MPQKGGPCTVDELAIKVPSRLNVEFVTIVLFCHSEAAVFCFKTLPSPAKGD